MHVYFFYVNNFEDKDIKAYITQKIPILKWYFQWFMESFKENIKFVFSFLFYT